MYAHKWFNTPKKLTLWIFCFVMGTFAYLTFFDRFTPSTSDASLESYIVPVSAQVSGKIIHLPIKDNQFVKQGDLLFEVDPRPYLYAYQKIKADTPQDQLSLQEAAFQLEQTKVFAPTDGFVTNLHIQEGVYATEGKTQLILIDTKEWWIEANFKENNLGRIQPGQRVDITLNMYPGRIFKGRVESISWGVMVGEVESKSELPKVEKTNNWIRLAQRFPVKIILDNPPKDALLRVGTSAIVTIYTEEDTFLNTFPSWIQKLRAKLQYLY